MSSLTQRVVGTFVMIFVFLEIGNVFVYQKLKYFQPHHLDDPPVVQQRLRRLSDDDSGAIDEMLPLDSFPFYPSPWPIMDITMRYLVNNDICNSIVPPMPTKNRKKILLLILIHSHAGNAHVRAKIRESLPKTELMRLNMRRVFLLANPEDNESSSSSTKNANQSAYRKTTMKHLLEENAQNFDLVVGDFVEAYRNLTYKHIMGLEWVTRFCPGAHFIVKQDDDTIVDFYQLTKLLNLIDTQEMSSSSIQDEEISKKTIKNEFFVQKLQTKLNSPDPRFIMGIPFRHSHVHRNVSSKWFVNRFEFSEDFYPPYTPGFFYLTTTETAVGILTVLNTQMDLPYFWIDDVHVTGTLRERAGIELMDMSKFVIKIKNNATTTMAECTSKMDHFDQSRRKGSKKPLFWCDYLARLFSTLPKDLKLFSVFYEHAKFCFYSNHCQFRL